MEIVQKVMQQAASILRDQQFIARHRLKPRAFTRRRKLPFERIVGTLIHLVRNSLQIVCNKLGEYFHMDDPASKQAFSQARSKFSHTCFQELNDMALQTFYQEDKGGVWKGYRVFAADGSTLRLPESPDTLAHFGRWDRGGENRSDACPVMGRISEFTDVISGLTVAAALLPWSIGEQTMAETQLRLIVEKMKSLGQEKLLFIYDRGYPSKAFFSLHQQLGVDFLFRMPRSFNKQIDTFAASGLSETILELYPGLPPLRIAAFPLPSGEREILLTSLTNSETIPYENLFSLYGTRWRTMEEGYKRQKVQFEAQNWATQSVLGILQEFWAMIYISNIVAMSCCELEGPSVPGQDLAKRLNRSVLVGSMRIDVLKTLSGELSSENFAKKFKKLAQRVKIPVRPGRSYSREGVGKPKRFFQVPRVC
jgi:hypothetical protein